MTKIKRPAFPYYGAKWRSAPWIISLFSEHDLYSEAFGATAAVMLQKERSDIEVYNDLNGDTVNFFSVLRDNEDELVRALHYTPYSYDEWKLSQEPADNPLEQARRFVVRMTMSVTQRPSDNPGWAVRKHASYNGRKTRCPAKTWMGLYHLHAIAERMRGVIIENRPALEILAYYDSPEALHYVDPPYVHTTRSRADGYKYEMDEDDHRQLADLLHNLQGKVILSGYDSELYQTLYPDWLSVSRSARISGNGSREEVLWLSPNNLVRSKPKQLVLLSP